MTGFDGRLDDPRLDRLKDIGFVNFGKGILSEVEIDTLSKSVKRAFDNAKLNSGFGEACDLIESSDCLGLRGLPEKGSEIAHLLNKVLSHGDVKQILSCVLGADYKIWQIDFRRSLPSDTGLSLHQDASGQVNMCLLLSDYPSADGATVFVPHSHLFPQRLRESFVELPAYLFKIVGRFLSPLLGEMGDICFFFNRNWHGRMPNTSSSARDVILIGLFPAGATFGYAGYHKWSEKFLEDISGTELQQLLDPNQGTKMDPSGNYRVVGEAPAPKPFSLQIEGGEAKRVSKVLLLLLKICRYFRLLIRLVRRQ